MMRARRRSDIPEATRQIGLRVTYTGPWVKLMFHLGGSLLSQTERYMEWVGSPGEEEEQQQQQQQPKTAVFEWKMAEFAPGVARDHKGRPLVSSPPVIIVWGLDDSDKRHKLFQLDLPIPSKAAGERRFTARPSLRKRVSRQWPKGRKVLLAGTITNGGISYRLQRRSGSRPPLLSAGEKRRILDRHSQAVHHHITQVLHIPSPSAVYWGTDDRYQRTDRDSSGHGRATLRATLLDMTMGAESIDQGRRSKRVQLSPEGVERWTRVFESILEDMKTHRRLLSRSPHQRRGRPSPPVPASAIDPMKDWLELVTWIVTRTHTYRGDVYSADYRTSHGTNAGDVAMVGGTGDCEDLLIAAGQLFSIFCSLPFADATRPSHTILQKMQKASLLYALGLLLCRVQGVKHSDNATLGSRTGAPIFHVALGAVPLRYFGRRRTRGGAHARLPVLLLESTNLVTTGPRAWIDVHGIPKRRVNGLPDALRQMHSMKGSQYYRRFLQFYTLDALRRSGGAEGFDLLPLQRQTTSPAPSSASLGGFFGRLFGGQSNKIHGVLQGVSKDDYFRGHFRLVAQPVPSAEYIALAREESRFKYNGFDWPEPTDVTSARRHRVQEAADSLEVLIGGEGVYQLPLPQGRPYCVGWMPLDGHFMERLQGIMEHYTVVLYPREHLDAVLVAIWKKKQGRGRKV